MTTDRWLAVLAAVTLAVGLLCFRGPHRAHGMDPWAILGAQLVAFGGTLGLVLVALAGRAL